MVSLRNILFWLVVAVLDVLGIGAICIGLWWIYPPVSLIVGGVLALVAAHRLCIRPPEEIE